MGFTSASLSCLWLCYCNCLLVNPICQRLQIFVWLWSTSTGWSCCLFWLWSGQVDLVMVMMIILMKRRVKWAALELMHLVLMLWKLKNHTCFMFTCNNDSWKWAQPQLGLLWLLAQLFHLNNVAQLSWPNLVKQHMAEFWQIWFVFLFTYKLIEQKKGKK